MKAERLEFHISYQCCNHCIFCSEKNRLKRFHGLNPSFREIADVLKKKKAEGFSYVTFTGGEPTASGNLPFALKLAKLLGYRTAVTTNGYAFSDIEYCHRYLPLCDEIILSVHGPSAEIHDRLTGRNGNFERFRKTIGNIEKLDPERIYLITNTLLLKQNAGPLAELYNMICRFRCVKQCILSNPAPEGGAFTEYDSIAMPLHEAGKRAMELAGIVKKHGKIIKLFGFPACVLENPQECSNDFFWSPKVTVERSAAKGITGLREVYSERPVRRRHYSRKCSECAYREKCGGFFNLPH